MLIYIYVMSIYNLMIANIKPAKILIYTTDVFLNSLLDYNMSVFSAERNGSYLG